MSDKVIEKVYELIVAYADAIIDGISVDKVERNVFGKFSETPRAVSSFAALLLARTEAVKDFHSED